MPKKIIVAVVCVFLIFIVFAVSAFAQENSVSLVINGKKAVCDVAPLISNGRTLVPARVLFETLNAKVDWNETLRQVIVTSADTVMIFNIDSPVMYLKGTKIILDTSPLIVNGRTLLPIRFISENLGYKVDWDEKTRTVFVNSENAYGNTQITDTPPKSGTENTDTKNSILLTSISANDSALSFDIKVLLSSKVTPRVTTLSGPYRIIFDFYGTNQKCKDGNIKSKYGFVKEVRWASHPDYTRVVVETDESSKYNVNYISDTDCIITVTKGNTSSSTEDNTLKNNNDKTNDKTNNKTDAEIKINPNSKYLVVIDAGHGGYDRGAVGRDESGEDILYESEVNLKIAKKVRDKLEGKNISVLMTRTGDTAFGDTEMDDLLKRVEIANNSGAMLFVSIHNNAFSNPDATGTCVLYSGLESVGDYGITGKELAKNIQDRLLECTKLYDRGIVESPGIVVLKKTVMPAALVECAFITCPKDQQLLLSDSKLDEMAKAICDGITASLRKMGIIT